MAQKKSRQEKMAGYEADKRDLPADISADEYEKRIKALAKKHRV